MQNTIVYLNGLYYPLHAARVSVLDRGFSYGDAVFETLHAYGGRVFRLEEHIDRLFRAADQIFLHLPMTRGEISQAVNNILGCNHFPDAILRVNVSRGEQVPGLHINPETTPTVSIIARSHAPLPFKYYTEGVKISLFPQSACRTAGVSPQIKSGNYLSQIVIRELAARKGAYEGILMDGNGYIAEGTTSNIFIVSKGVLKTPSLSEYVLAGITRQVVLEIARENNIPCAELPMRAEDVYEADEIFLTNTGIELLPVGIADERSIGVTCPGVTTRFLAAEFSKIVEGDK